MITKEITYKKAFENKSQRLKEKRLHRDMLLNAAYNANPRLSQIDNELSAIGAKIAITALSGDSEKISTFKKQSKALSFEKMQILKTAEVPELVYDCPLCSDSGYISGKICDCVKKEAARVMAAELSKQMPLNTCRFDNFDLKYYPDTAEKGGVSPRKRITAILKLCKEYAIKFSPETSENLLFMGGVGLGKTHLTMAITSAVIEKGYMPVYGSAENLFSVIEAEKFSSEGKGSYEAILNCDLLVIDDLGAEMITSFTKSVLYNIINTRLLTRKPTIINTNLTMAEISSKYDARIASRVMGSYTAKVFLGNDIRQQKLMNK